MIVRFGETEVYHTGKYDGWNDPSVHLMECQTLWESWPKDERVHACIHTLNEMPRSWYILAKLRREITTWEELTIFFAHTFSFADAYHNVHNELQIIWDVVLKLVSVTYPMDPHVHCHMQSMMEWYNRSGEPEDDDELWNINIPETEGSRDVVALDIAIDPMSQPLKIRKVNIGTKENPKFASVGDDWDAETMTKITELLHGF